MSFRGPAPLVIPRIEMEIGAAMRVGEQIAWHLLADLMGYSPPVLRRNFAQANFVFPPLLRRNLWPVERTEHFLRLIAAGVGVRAAGRAVGVTPNAAIGKWHRIKGAEKRNAGRAL